MEKILIISDSACDIPKEEVERYGIGILPVMVSYGGKTYAEYYDIVPKNTGKCLKKSTKFQRLRKCRSALTLRLLRKRNKTGIHMCSVF